MRSGNAGHEAWRDIPLSATRLETLLEHGQALYDTLDNETTHFLGSFAWTGVDESDAFEKRRQELVTAVQYFDAELQRVLSAEPGNDETLAVIADFRQMQADVTGRVIKSDAALISLAQESMRTLQDGLTALSEGKKALNGYSEERDVTSLFRQTV